MSQVIKKGWLYVLTCEHYKRDDLYKIGFTEKPGELEDDVKKQLLQRYGTYLINSEIIMLVPVSYPKDAESEVFKRLKDYRHQKEIFKADFNSIIRPQIIWAQTEYNITEPYEIREEILTKILHQFSKKGNKIINDIDIYTRLKEWLYINLGKINVQNQNIIRQYLMNNFGNFTMVGVTNWKKLPQNIATHNMRKSQFNQVCDVRSGYDRKDKKLHAFLKDMIQVV